LQNSHVIPALIRKLSDAVRDGRREVEIWGTGEPSREFLYVEDAAEGILLAAEHYNSAEPVNLGNGQEIKIKELVEMIARLVGYSGERIWNRSQPDGQPRRALDTSRALEAFGFRAKTGLEAGLQKTIAWYREAQPLTA
jgi:GDP-L-fucose synthase